MFVRKVEILDVNLDFFFENFDFLNNIYIFGQNFNFSTKMTILTTNSILDVYQKIVRIRDSPELQRNYCQSLRFTIFWYSSEIEILVQIVIFVKIEMLPQNLKFLQKVEIFEKIEIDVKYVYFWNKNPFFMTKKLKQKTCRFYYQ